MVGLRSNEGALPMEIRISLVYYFFHATGTEPFHLPHGKHYSNDKDYLLVKEDPCLYLSLNKHKRIICFISLYVLLHYFNGLS